MRRMSTNLKDQVWNTTLRNRSGPITVQCPTWSSTYAKSCQNRLVQWLSDSLWIFLGAGLGANGRFWLGRWVMGQTGQGFPWGTFVVNVSGCLAIGLVAGLLLNLQAGSMWRNLLIVGFLGGYTTFSSFSNETYGLIQSGSYLPAFGNIFGSVVVGLLGTWLGDVLARLLHGGRP